MKRGVTDQGLTLVSHRSRRPSPARDWLLVAPAYVVPGVASFVLVPVLFSVLGPGEYGRWVLIYAVAVGVPQVTSTWLEAVTIRFGHRQSIDVRLTAMALALTVTVAGLAAALFVPGLDVFGVLAAAIYTGTIASYVLAIASLQSRQRFGSLASTAVLRSLLTAAFAAMAALIGHSAPAVAFGSAIGYLLGIAVAWIAGTRRPPERQEAQAAPLEAIEEGLAGSGPPADGPPRLSAKFVGSSVVIAVALFALSVGDRFVLSAFRPLSEVGVYAATYSMADLAGRLIPSVVLVTLRPRVYRAWDAGQRTWVREQVTDAAFILAWIGAAVAITLLGLAVMNVPLPIDPGLIGPISVGLAAMFASNALGLAYTAAGRQATLAWQVALTAALAIGANLLLAPMLGARGAALVTLVAYATQLAITVTWLPRSPRARERSPRWLGLAIASVGLTIALMSWFGTAPIGFAAAAVGLLVTLPGAIRGILRISRSSPS